MTDWGSILHILQMQMSSVSSGRPFFPNGLHELVDRVMNGMENRLFDTMNDGGLLLFVGVDSVVYVVTFRGFHIFFEVRNAVFDEDVVP